MNYGEIKQNLISLGFAEESDYQEYEDLGYTYDAINRAISQINDKFPYLDKYEFEIDDSDDGYIYADISRRNGFLELADMPVLIEKGDEGLYKRFGDYEVEMEHTIVIDSIHKGRFRVFYKKACTPITVETDDTFVPELQLKAHHLIPLLAAYYLWLDDDAAKATQYYNMYETELATLLQRVNEKPPRMRVVTEWGGM